MFETESLILAIGQFGKKAAEILDEKLLAKREISYCTEEELSTIKLTAETVFVILDKDEITEVSFMALMDKLSLKRSLIFVKGRSKLQSMYATQVVFNFTVRDIFAVEKIHHIIADLTKLSDQLTSDYQERINQVLFDTNCECYMNTGCGIGSSEDKRVKLAIQSILAYLTSNSKTYKIRAILLNIHSNKALSQQSRDYIENIIQFFIVPKGIIVIQEVLDDSLENKVMMTTMMSVKRNSQSD